MTGLPRMKPVATTADRGGYTLAEIGQALGITKERVRQIEAKALAKLRAACSEAGLSLSDLLPPDSPMGRETYTEPMGNAGPVDHSDRVCARSACGATYTPGERGQQQVYCSRRCTQLAWMKSHGAKTRGA